MPDLTGLTALDVAIGLAFLYFTLSTVCSAIQEFVAGMFGWRAKTLEKAIAQLLHDPAKAQAFWRDPRIVALAQPVKRKLRKPLIEAADGTPLMTPDGALLRKPSYIPARTFALAFFDTVAPDAGAGADKSADVIAKAKLGAEHLPGALRHSVLDVLAHGREDIDAVRMGVETGFDHVMERASGWYKRTAQRWLLVIALVIAAAGNVDTFQIAHRLWKDDTMRAVIVQRAESEAQVSTEGTEDVDAGTLDSVAAAVDDVEALDLPIGWTKGNVPTDDGVHLAWDIVGKILGILVTALALMLGAPFWFDLLGRFARLRSTGKREGTAKDEGRLPEDRDDLTGPAPGITTRAGTP